MEITEQEVKNFEFIYMDFVFHGGLSIRSLDSKEFPEIFINEKQLLNLVKVDFECRDEYLDKIVQTSLFKKITESIYFQSFAIKVNKFWKFNDFSYANAPTDIVKNFINRPAPTKLEMTKGLLKLRYDYSIYKWFFFNKKPLIPFELVIDIIFSLISVKVDNIVSIKEVKEVVKSIRIYQNELVKKRRLLRKYLLQNGISVDKKQLGETSRNVTRVHETSLRLLDYIDGLNGYDTQKAKAKYFVLKLISRNRYFRYKTKGIPIEAILELTPLVDENLEISVDTLARWVNGRDTRLKDMYSKRIIYSLPKIWG